MKTKTFTASATFPVDRIKSFAIAHWRIDVELQTEHNENQPDLDTFINNLIKNHLMDFLWRPTIEEIIHKTRQEQQEQITRYKKELKQSIIISNE